jgi:hypothetical protein
MLLEELPELSLVGQIPVVGEGQIPERVLDGKRLPRNSENSVT